VLAFFAQKLISRARASTCRTTPSSSPRSIRASFKDVTIQTKDNTLDVALKSGRKYQTAYRTTRSRSSSSSSSRTRSGSTCGARGGGWITVAHVRPAIRDLPVVLAVHHQPDAGRRLEGQSFGKSRAKRMSVDSPKISFRDVAGVDEGGGELHEIKEFLREPEEVPALGARIPKGVLLYGPPGTGKTLLAARGRG